MTEKQKENFADNIVLIYCDGEPIGINTTPNGLIDWSKETHSVTTETIHPPINFEYVDKFDAPEEVKTDMEYYLHRKGTYYLREQKWPFRKIVFTVDNVPEDLKKLKYGTIVGVTVGYE